MIRGGVLICNNKKEFDMERARKLMTKNLSYNYYWFSREWAYKDIKPRIIVEKKIESTESVPKDYKIFCFNGTAKFWYITHDRGADTKLDFYDMEWNKIAATQRYPSSNYEVEKPECWGEMVRYAETLSEGYPHLRVDFYVDKYGKFFIGELTLTPSSGLIPILPEKYDDEFGEYIDLSVADPG